MKATLKWGKVNKRTWRSDGPYRIERRARDQFVAINEDNEQEHLGCWGKLDLAKEACERHRRGEPEPEQAAKLSIAGGALDWQETEPGSGIWETAADDGGRYTCTEIGGGTWRAGYSLTRLVPLWPEQINLAGAQLLCEQHYAGRGIEWVTWAKDGADWFVYKDSSGHYSCQQDEDGEQWVASWSYDDDDHDDDDHELGAGTLDEAQAICQIHRGKRLLLEAAKGTLPETAKALGLDVGERDTKPNNGPEAGELGEWSIPVPLTEPELAKLGQRLGELTVQLGRETLRIASAKEAAKRTVKAAEAEIQRLNELALPLAENLDTGEEYRLVRCRQHKDSDAGELYYTDPETGEELHRRAVAKGEQQELWGKSPPPADKPPERLTDEELVEAIEKQLAGSPDAETDEAQDDPLPPELDLTDKKRWRKVCETYIAGDPERHYAVSKTSRKLWVVDFRSPGADARELPGEHTRLKDAFAEADKDNKTRLRWPGDPASGLLVSKCGKYQLSRYMVAGPAGVMWRALHLPGQDREPVDLGDHLLPEAQAACQAHADAGRAGR